MKLNPSAWAFISFFSIIFIQLFTDIPIFAYFFAILLIAIFGFGIIIKLDINPFYQDKLSKEEVLKTKTKFKITDIQWKKFSRDKQKELYDYCYRQERIKNWIVSEKFKKEESLMKNTNNLLKFYENRENHKTIIKKNVDKDWENLSLEERIELINVEEKRKLDADKKEKIRWEKIKLKQKELDEKREYDKRMKEENESLIKQEDDRRKAEEQAKRDQKEREEQERLEQLRKQELIEERKKQKDKEYKERIKQELLEKERKKYLESEAIQELIDIGKLSDNFSLQFDRISIPSHIREAVWKRDKNRCASCGSNQKLELDHIIPVSKGGSNTINNIELLCQNCNRKKSNKIM